MFVHQSRLKHVLSPEAYWRPEFHKLELERLFQSTWNLVASTADLANDGDFLTLDLLGHPILVRNFGGQIHTFLNVCAHRHCMLTNEAQGNSPQLRCQYHGWEYDENGRTGRIPESKCFAPWERDRAHLPKFRTEACGDLIFVSLDAGGCSLEEFLGEAKYAECQTAFAHPWRQAWAWTHEFEANWKIVVENSLETYHLSCLHANTFGENPSEKFCTHELAGTHSTFELDIQYHKSNRLQKRTLRTLGGASTDTYRHHHTFPAFIWTQSDTYRMAQSLWPTSPTTCQTVIRLYSFRGDKTNPWARIIAALTAHYGRVETKRIIKEDVDVFPSVQRGNERTVHQGVLGTREERLFVFQDYVARECEITAQTEPTDTSQGLGSEPLVEPESKSNLSKSESP